MNTQYYAVNAKLKAMSANFLTEDDYDVLLAKSGVGEICGYLKNNTVYREVLSEINEEEIHRTELEKRLNRQCYDEYIRIFKFLGLYERKAFNYYLLQKEIECIKYSVKRVFQGKREHSPPETDEFLKNHTKLDIEALMNANDFYSVMEACRNTGYYDLLYRENVSELKTEAIIMMLDRYYYKLLWSEISKYISGGAELMDLFGKKVDLLNILWIYRCKKYFHLSNEMIYTHIIPIGYKMSREKLSDIISGDIDNLIETVKHTRYAWLFENIDEGEFAEENYRRIMHDIISKKFRTAKEPVTLAVSYFLLKNNEIQNIKTITEGKRYSSDIDSIKKLIVY